MKLSKKLTVGKTLIYLIVTLVALICLLPLVLVVIVSFTAEAEILRNGYSFFPHELSLEAYKTLLKNGGEVARCYVNSVGITVIGTVLATCITAVSYTHLAWWLWCSSLGNGTQKLRMRRRGEREGIFDIERTEED